MQNFFLSYFKTLSVGPVGVELTTSRMTTRCSTRTIYTPPVECEGLSYQCFFKSLHFLWKMRGLAGQFWQKESALKQRHYQGLKESMELIFTVPIISSYPIPLFALPTMIHHRRQTRTPRTTYLTCPTVCDKCAGSFTSRRIMNIERLWEGS